MAGEFGKICGTVILPDSTDASLARLTFIDARRRAGATVHMDGDRIRHIFAVHFDIVHGCQLRCVGCPNSTLEPKIERIAVDDFARCLANIDVERVHTLRLYNYGEPLLHRQLSSIVAQIPQQSWKASVVEISTNAQWVDWDEFEKMLKLEVVTRLCVSCDGDGTPGEYESLRPPSKWSKLVEFLDRAVRLRDRWSPNLQLWTRTVVRTQTDMRRWDELLRPRGWTPEFRRWMALPQAAQNMTGRAVVTPHSRCVFVSDPSEFVDHPWFGEINLLYVDADGTVVPCCMHPGAARLGNLMEQRYSEIVRSDVRKRFIDDLENRRATMSVCGTCDVGPAGNEGPSFWSQIAYWSPNKTELPVA
jgi:radical SAM protein with 4Fe4S-binding SPASM domain